MTAALTVSHPRLSHHIPAILGFRFSLGLLGLVLPDFFLAVDLLAELLFEALEFLFDVDDFPLFG